MATFEERVEGLTTLAITGSSTPTQSQLTEFLKDGVIDVTNKWLSIRPEDSHLFIRISSESTSQAGASARTAQGNRARVKSNARKRAQAAAKKRKAKKAASKRAAPKKRSAPKRSRTRTSRRRRGRRGRRRCDIRCKVNISLLMNMNLLRDDLADVAYFVKELQESNEK